MYHIDHKKISSELVILCKNEMDKKIINRFLEKYDIDINYYNSFILYTICTQNDNHIKKVTYHNIKILVKMGADPRPLLENNIIILEKYPTNRIIIVRHI
jgi:hypothetical protein